MRRKHQAFTLVELLVVIAIIGILIAMALPAVQASRETARRLQCRQNLQVIGQALARYYAAYECYPAGVENDGGPIRNEPRGRHISWICSLLPYLDAEVYARKLDLTESVYAAKNDEVRKSRLFVVQCPSFPRVASQAQLWAGSHYAACYHDQESPIDVGTNGAFVLNSYFTERDFPDGMGFTLFLSEKGVDEGDLGWASGTRATLRNTGETPGIWGRPRPIGKSDSASKTENGGMDRGENGKEAADTSQEAESASDLLFVGGFSSAHPAVIQVLIGPQTVKAVGLTIDPIVWRQLANRSDGSLPPVDLAP